MITAVDTNILIDVFRNDPVFGATSADTLRRCIREGRIVICEVVMAELAAIFPSTEDFQGTTRQLRVEFLPMEAASVVLAGEIWRRYRVQGGSRQRVMADFLVAAHAQQQCDRLLTRDRGFYRKYFKKLHVMDSSK